MNELEQKILLDYEITKRCLDEDIPESAVVILRLWLKYDEELLAIIRKDKINEYGSTKKSK
jgi:hypothetical protein